MEKKILFDLEAGYDKIAEKFSQTRNFFWRDFEFLEKYVEEKDYVLDFGCGNGRLAKFLENKKINYFGVDVSQNLVNIAKKKYPEKIFSKINRQDSLSFNDIFFNKIFAIAVFHHFPPEAAFFWVKELKRVLVRGGTIVITVWNLRQEEYFNSRKKIMAKPCIFLLKITKGMFLKDIIIFIHWKNFQKFFLIAVLRLKKNLFIIKKISY